MKVSQIKARVARANDGVAYPVELNGEAWLAADGSPVTMTILGDQSSPRRQIQDAEDRVMLSAQAEEATPDDIRRRRVNLAAACVAGWHGFEDDDDKPIPHSQRAVRDLLAADADLLLWVEKRVRARSRFLAEPSPVSATT